MDFTRSQKLDFTQFIGAGFNICGLIAGNDDSFGAIVTRSPGINKLFHFIISKDGSIILLNTVDLPGPCWDLSLFNGRFCFRRKNFLKVFFTYDPTSRILSRYEINHPAKSVCANQSYLFIGCAGRILCFNKQFQQEKVISQSRILTKDYNRMTANDDILGVLSYSNTHFISVDDGIMVGMHENMSIVALSANLAVIKHKNDLIIYELNNGKFGKTHELHFQRLVFGAVCSAGRFALYDSVKFNLIQDFEFPAKYVAGCGHCLLVCDMKFEFPTLFTRKKMTIRFHPKKSSWMDSTAVTKQFVDPETQSRKRKQIEISSPIEYNGTERLLEPEKKKSKSQGCSVM